MKKILTGLVVAAALASIAMAQETKSANAVGFIKKTIEPGKYAPIVYPFDILGSTNSTIKFTEMQIADELPAESEVYFWTGSSWVSAKKNKNAAIGWMGEASRRTLADGEMFFVKPAGNSTLTEYTLSGEVPAGGKTVRAIDSSDPERLNSVGFAYPTETTFKTTSLASNAPAESTVFFWTGSSWVSAKKNKNAAIGWMGEASKKVLAPGEGFFIKFPSEGVTSWEQEKPYTWP